MLDLTHRHNGGDGHCDDDDDTGDHDGYSSGVFLQDVECVVVRWDMADGNALDGEVADAVEDEDDDGKDDGDDEVLVAVDNDWDDGKIQAIQCYCWRMEKRYCC